MINSTDTFNIFADFYDLYVGKFDSDFEFYKFYCSKADKIIEIGCGTGRILEYFLRMDYKLTGIDTSQEMLNKASTKLKHWIDSGKLNLLKHDFSINSLKDKFDKALVTFYTFNYILDKPVDFLSNIYNTLENNGILLMDLFYPNPLYDKSINNKWIEKKYSITDNQIMIKDKRSMTAYIERRQQIFCIGDKEIKIDTDRRYYPPVELKDCLEKAGYVDIKFSMDYIFSGFCTMIDESKLKNNYIVKARRKKDRIAQ